MYQGSLNKAGALNAVNQFSVICQGDDDTAYIAAAIAPVLHPGDAMMLKGGLAGGKTTFVQALVAALGSEADVTSPTFTLAHFYPTRAGMFLHVDAYRLSSIAEYRDLGLEDYTYNSITAVEWGDKVEKDFPDSLSIVFEFVNNSETCRKLTFSSSTDRWRFVLHDLCLRVPDHLKA
jgi:tRNA threonylcarbamoyladenosine biosynthesis protein TsaE